MTTANEILTASFPNMLSVPLEAVFNEAGYQYIYRKDGSRVVKQMIEAGTMNDNEIIVRKGLAKDDVVLLAPPADTAGLKTVRLPGLKPMSAPVAAPAPVRGDTPKTTTVPAQPKR
jgi:hypothetical protein